MCSTWLRETYASSLIGVIHQKLCSSSLNLALKSKRKKSNGHSLPAIHIQACYSCSKQTLVVFYSV